MANKTITQLTPLGATPAGSAELPIMQAGATRKVTVAELSAAVVKKVLLETIGFADLTAAAPSQDFVSAALPAFGVPICFNWNVSTLFRSGVADPAVTAFQISGNGFDSVLAYLAGQTIFPLWDGGFGLGTIAPPDTTAGPYTFTVYTGDGSNVNLATQGALDIWAIYLDCSV